MELEDVLSDLAAESADADRIVADLTPQQWATPTPAEGWTVAHQVAHLAWTDVAATLAITDPAGFQAHLESAIGDPDGFVDRGAEQFLAETPDLLGTWRQGRSRLADALRSVPAGGKVPWYGTAMSPISMATARLMETWAHGLDLADTFGVTREPTDRLRHIAHLGHRTLGHAFAMNGRELPAEPVRLELTAPDLSLWTFGPADATNRVSGPALDFCLLVTRRRHRADLDLTATGPVADAWLDIAQAFAGPGGDGRQPTTGA